MLRGRLPEIVGECMRPERVNPASGDLEQQTTGGLLVRRQADGLTTFTDGKTTWINGPSGLVNRPNEGPLFPWEAGAAPVGPDGLLGAPRAAGEFVYGALLADPAGNATLAKAAGFSHMWAHVAWRQVEPTPGEFLFRTLELWRAVMERHGDAGKGAFITELGTLEHTPLHLGGFEWMKLAPDRRAEYLVRALRLANANYPWIRGAMIFNLDYAATPWNPPTSEHYWFSLLNPDRSPRPAYEAFWRARRDGTLP